MFLSRGDGAVLPGSTHHNCRGLARAACALTVACTLLWTAFRPDGALAPGTEQPVTPLSGRRLMVDPGHGGIDSGCSSGPLIEKAINLAIAREVARLLMGWGADATLTRSEDTALDHLTDPRVRNRHLRDLMARVDLAREHRTELFVSIHTNIAGSAALGGALTFYQPGHPDSLRLARLIQSELSPLVPGNQNGVLPARFHVLRNLDAPGVLVEVGFLSHPKDRATLANPAGHQAIAAAITRAIVTYYAGPAPAPREPTPGSTAPDRPAASPDSGLIGVHNCGAAWPAFFAADALPEWR